MTGERDGSPDRPSDDPVHPDLDRLLGWSAGALSADDSVEHEVATHVADCAECTRQVETLTQVSTLLAAQPAPAMPADVFARLNDVVAMESASRIAVGSGAAHRGLGGRATAEPSAHLPPPSSSGPDHGDPHPRPLLGSFADRPGARPSRRGRLGRVLGGLVLAGVLGAAGYVLSASVGLNEPTAVDPVSVNSSSLQRSAVAAEADDLSPHRFSRAWRCAREVTDGSITGIRPVVVDGDPSYLVFTDDDDGASAATLVTGCAEGRPKSGASVLLPQR